MNAIAAVNVAGAGGNCPTVGGRKRRGRRACRQREKKNTKEEISGCGERAEDAEDRVGGDRPTVAEDSVSFANIQYAEKHILQYKSSSRHPPY